MQVTPKTERSDALAEARVLVVDADPHTRSAMCSVVEACGARPHCAADLAGAKAALDGGHPLDLAIVDPQVEAGTGLDFVARLRRAQPFVAILSVTDRPEPAWARRALQTGADDFLYKPLDVLEFVATVEELVRRARARRARLGATPTDGRVETAPFAQASPVEHLAVNGVPSSDAESGRMVLREHANRIAARVRLSRREHEVLLEVLGGRTNPEIASRLGISIRTVKFHLQNLVTKCGVKGRAGLTALLWGKGTGEEARLVRPRP